MMKKFYALVAVIVATVLLMLATQACVRNTNNPSSETDPYGLVPTANTTFSSNHEKTAFNEHDLNAIVAFLEQTSDDGKKNGEILYGASYSVSDPLTWTGIRWIDDNNERRIGAIELQGGGCQGILDVSLCTRLETISVRGQKLTALNASGCDALKSISCERQIDEMLTKIDVSNCLSLNRLFCAKVGLQELNINGCNNLIALDCASNKLQNIDLSEFVDLIDLDCSGNGIEKLDVSNNVALENLVCSNNEIEYLELSMNTELQSLNCDNNRITRIDLSRNTRLTTLFCNYTALSELDVSSNTALKALSCYQCQLEKIDATGCVALEEIVCFDNPTLTNINLSGCAALTTLSCYNNAVSTIDVSDCPNLIVINVENDVEIIGK